MDWITVLLYLLMVLLGWLNIFAVVFDETTNQNIFDLSLNSGRQLVFILASVLLIVAIMTVDFRFYDTFALVIYGIAVFLLLAVLLFGREIAGSQSWLEIGRFKLQPSEFSKFATALAAARVISTPNFKFDKLRSQAILLGVIALPAGLVMLQGDTGTAMVFASFLLVFYREGMSPVLIISGMAAAVVFILTLLVPNQFYLYSGVIVIGLILVFAGKKNMKRLGFIAAGIVVVIGFSRSVDYVVTNVLKPHQQNRIKALINPDADPLGYGWNVTQSKIAIGSGGFGGKGFLRGTQTKFDFVPEQSTDFIFCTIGEEHGWIGSLITISLFILLFVRVINLAERQKWRFSRVYGYSVACIMFFHFAVNIGMTIGLFPVIGIPLPFFSYGGSSLWAFTILLFVLVKLDAHRMQVLLRS